MNTTVPIIVLTEDVKENFGARLTPVDPQNRRGPQNGRKLFRDITKEIVKRKELDCVSVLTATG